jgi:hypothetical protein
MTFNIITAVFGILLSSQLSASMPNTVIDQLSWQPQKTTKNIQIYSAKVPNSRHKAILSVTTVNAKPQEIVQLLRNTDICAQWIYRCKHSRQFRAITPQEDYIYTTTNMPFPVKNRDILAHIVWEKDPKTRTITATGTATMDALAPQKGFIRIKEAKMIWEITPLSNGDTQIRNYGHINPAGAIPVWLSNRLSTNVPFKTLSGLRQVLGESR